ncbi:MAG TPA: hypothetical protein DDX75_08990 [Phycisphaerales bacterium]|nr:hypothetical protein [Phycisphaerales bacterium]
MQQYCPYGTVRGAVSNRSPYRDLFFEKLRKRFSDMDELKVLLTQIGEPKNAKRRIGKKWK